MREKMRTVTIAAMLATLMASPVLAQKKGNGQGGDYAGALGRAFFKFAPIPPAGQPAVTLATLTMVAPVSGTALVHARGYCNLVPNGTSNNQMTLTIGQSVADAFDSSPDPAIPGVSEWGLVIVPPAAAMGLYQPMWSAERALEVVGGNTYTVSLFGRHDSGSVINDCSGTMTIELFTMK
jgi:hypothetical protein